MLADEQPTLGARVASRAGCQQRGHHATLRRQLHPYLQPSPAQHMLMHLPRSWAPPAGTLLLLLLGQPPCSGPLLRQRLLTGQPQTALSSCRTGLANHHLLAAAHSRGGRRYPAAAAAGATRRQPLGPACSPQQHHCCSPQLGWLPNRQAATITAASSAARPTC